MKIKLKNTLNTYGFIAIFFHWLMVPIVLSLYGLGLWMEDLDYYSPWYKTAPDWHKSIGVIMIFLMSIRFFWRLYNPKVLPLEKHKQWEKKFAHIVHNSFYIAVFIMFVSGFLITTAKGARLEVFNWFSLPSVIKIESNLQDIAGQVHEICAHIIFGAIVLHVAGALKHYFFDRDATLKRIWFFSKNL